MVKAAQFMVMLAVGFGLIWFQETYHQKLNPYMVLACIIAVPYFGTLAIIKLLDWRTGLSAGQEQSGSFDPLEPAEFLLSLRPGEFTRTDSRRRPL